jgi:hypothetical protein
MSKFILFTDGKLAGRYDSLIHGERLVSIIDPSFVWPQIEQQNYEYDSEESLDGPTIFVDDHSITPPTILVENPDCKIPAEAIEVSDELFFQTINETDGEWSLVNDNIVKLPIVIIPETQEQIISRLEKALDKHLDEVANSYRYESIRTMTDYRGDPNPKFNEEGWAAFNWRSACYTLSIQIMEDVLSGKRDVPTEDELIGLMPKIAL